MQFRCVVIMALILSLASLASNKWVRCCTNGDGDQQSAVRQMANLPAADATPALWHALALESASLKRESAGITAGALAEASAADMNARAQSRSDENQAHHCLSLNVYWEARNQSIAGQIAVAQVAINRARDPRFPDDICQVVYEHKQFSWYWDGKSDTPRDSRAWEASRLVASAALAGSGHAELQGVTHYHAVYSQPYWRSYMTQVTTIGDHIFYSD